MICIADPAEAAARDAVMVAAAASGRRRRRRRRSRSAPGVLRDGDPHAGQLFVQGRVRAATDGLFDDVVGRGWSLSSTAGDPRAALGREAAAFFASLGGIAAHVAPEAPVRDLDGSYRRWFASAASPSSSSGRTSTCSARRRRSATRRARGGAADRARHAGSAR